MWTAWCGVVWCGVVWCTHLLLQVEISLQTPGVAAEMHALLAALRQPGDTARLLHVLEVSCGGEEQQESRRHLGPSQGLHGNHSPPPALSAQALHGRLAVVVTWTATEPHEVTGTRYAWACSFFCM